MAKQERTRKSTAEGKTKSYRDADRVIEPWFPLNDKELEVFDGYVRSREVDTWLPADIEALTQLSRVAVQMRECWDSIERDGRTIFTDKGWPAANPEVTIYSQLSGIYGKLRTALGMSASQRGVAGNKQASRNQQDAHAAEKVDNSDKIAALLPRH